MKKYYLRVMLILTAFLYAETTVLAQAVECPNLTVNDPILDCSTPCATLNVTPNVDLAATTSYSVAAVTYSPYSFSSGTDATEYGATMSGSYDDNFSDVVSLPFNFCFFGVSYSSLVIGTNGNLSFTSSLADAYDPWPISGPIPGSGAGGSATAVHNCIMSPWQDLYPPSGGTIKYAVYGVAPCREFVISWDNVALFITSGVTPSTYQTVLYESSNIIDINIQTRDPYTSWNNGYAVTGICNSTGSLYYTAPGENGTTFTASNLAWRFTPTGTVTPWSYTWTGPGGTVGTGSSVVVCPTTTTVYTVTGTSGACTGVEVAATSTVTVTSTTTPITGNPSVCLGYTTALTDATAGGVWVSSNTGVATVNTTGVVTSVSGGTTTISYTAAGCTSQLVVTVNTAPPISGPTTLCEGGTMTLSDAVAGGTWVSSNTAVATVGLNTGTVSGITAGTTVITYTTPAGCVTTSTLNIFVLSSISGTRTVCEGSTTALSDADAGGAWTSGNPTVASVIGASGLAVVTGETGGTANITYTTPGGCYTSSVVTVNPISPITGTLYMCQNYTTTLSNTLPGGVWSTGNAAVAIVNSSTGVVTGLSGGTATISYTLPTGCLMTAVVTVHPKPTPPAAPSITVCQHLLATLTVTLGSGNTPLWYGPGITTGTPFAPAVYTDTAGVTHYFVTQTTVFGCTSDSTELSVTVIPQPVAPVTTNSTYCQYSATSYLNTQVDSASGSHLLWATAAGTAIDSTPLPPSNVVTYPLGTTWLVRQVVNGCTSNPTPAVVTIVYQPNFTIKASGPWVCDHDTLSFSYSSITPLLGGSFHWQLPPGATIVGGTATDSAISVRFDSVYGPHVINLTVGELNDLCTTTEPIQITVVPLPTAYAHMTPNICVGDTVGLALSEESNNASLYSWLIDDTSLQSSTELNIIAANSNSGGPFSVSWNSAGLHIITVSAATSEGCKSVPTYDTVDVHPLPDASFIYKTKSNSALCLEDSVEFIANNNCYNCAYLWQPIHDFNNDNKPEIWGKMNEEQNNVMLTITDPFGCVGMFTQQLDPGSCCTVLFPNAFTPNNDNRNDVFRPIFSGYHNFHSFRIVNRWGQTVFESSNSLPSWDGNMNGVPQDIGTYYYFLEYDCGGSKLEAKGDLTLIR